MIKNILVFMFLHEVVYPLAFYFTLINKSFLTLLLLVHLLLKQQTMGQTVLLQLTQHSVDSALVILSIRLNLFLSVDHDFLLVLESLIQLLLIQTIHRVLVSQCRVGLRFNAISKPWIPLIIKTVQFSENGCWRFVEILYLCGFDVVVLDEGCEMVLLGHVEVIIIRRNIYR